MDKKFTRKEWEQRKRIKKIIRLGIVILIGLTMLAFVCLVVGIIYTKTHQSVSTQSEIKKMDAPEMVEAFLTPNEYSRPGILLNEVNGVVVHYTANPGTTGWENRNYFENLKDTHTAKVSSHFIIGLDGTIIQNIPLNEIAYASNDRNNDTISIELCHPDKDGSFTKQTYQSLVKLTRWLAFVYKLDQSDIIRHYDVTGKNCPKYFVEKEDKWLEFLEQVFEDKKKIR